MFAISTNIPNWNMQFLKLPTKCDLFLCNLDNYFYALSTSIKSLSWVKTWVLVFISFLISEKMCEKPLRYSRLALWTKMFPNTLPLSNKKEKITCSHKQDKNLRVSSQLKNSLSKYASLTSEYHLRQDVQRMLPFIS